MSYIELGVGKDEGSTNLRNDVASQMIERWGGVVEEGNGSLDACRISSPHHRHPAAKARWITSPGNGKTLSSMLISGILQPC
jgi:hypothetical protein